METQMINQTLSNKTAKALLGILSMVALVTTVGCNKGDSGAASSNTVSGTGGVLAMTPSPASVATGGTVLLSFAGGTAPYTFSIVSSGGGTLSQASGSFTIFTAPAVAGTAQILVHDSGSLSAYFPVTITGSTGGQTLAITPDNTSVVASGAVTFNATGGSGGYMYSVVSGGGSFTGNVFYAPSTAQTVTVKVTDSNGNFDQTTVTVTAAPVATVTCSGLYDMNLNGAAVTLYIVQDSVGNIAGSMTAGASTVAIAGSCVSGSIHFINNYSHTPYSGTYFADPNHAGHVVMSGTYSSGGHSYSWFAQTH